MRRLYYIRHGQTVDMAKKIKSTPETSLTPLGLREATAAGVFLASRTIQPSLIVCSKFPRAIQSAEAVAQAIGYNRTILEEPLLNERDCGEAEGLPMTEVERRWPDGIDAVPDAETIPALQERAAKAIKWLQRLKDDTVVVVGHATLGRAIMREFAGLPYENEYQPGRFTFRTGQVISLFPRLTTEL